MANEPADDLSKPGEAGPSFVPADALIIPPANPVSEDAPVPHNTRSQAPVIISIVAGLAVLAGVAYAVVILPRQNAVRMVDSVKPEIVTLKSATSSVIENLRTMYSLATSKPAEEKQNVETTGVIITPDIASLADGARVLGTAISRGGSSIVENEVQSVARRMQGSMRVFLRVDSDVAGASTPSEDEHLKTYRTLKDETVKTSESVSRGQSALGRIVALSGKTPMTLSGEAKSALGGSVTLNLTAGGFLTQAKYISDYYRTLSDIVITMNTKIASFKTAMQSAGAGFGTVLQTSDTGTARTALSQVQVFLDQANKDMLEIQHLSETLQAIPKESLPMGSDEYHAHNVKVLDVATTYFKTQSAILQGFVKGAQDLVGKAEQGMLTSADQAAFQAQMMRGVSEAAVSDAKFASDLQSLTGEETTLAVSFWQNNTRLADGEKVAEAIQAYQTSLEKLRQNNTVPGIIR